MNALLPIRLKYSNQQDRHSTSSSAGNHTKHQASAIPNLESLRLPATAMDSLTICRVIEVKIAVSATLERITAIDKMQSAWESDDEDHLKSNWTKLKLACEYTLSELEATQRLCLQILDIPPPYTISSPDDRLHQAYEIQVRIQRTESFIDDLCEVIQTLVDKCEDGTGEIQEVQLRANVARCEVEHVLATAKDLFSVVRERVLEQTIAVLPSTQPV